MPGGTMTSKYLRIREMFLLWYSITCLEVFGVTAETCYSPVYLELGRTGTIQCSFPDGFHSVQWYDVVDIFGETAILAYDESREKDGPGYWSGEFDIHPDGSLIIRNVSIEHGTTYTVTLFQTSQQLPQHYQVHVKTIVKPLQNRPVVSSCENTNGSCYIEWTQSTNVSCQIEHSRPAIDITWSLRNSSGDNIVPSRHESSSDATTHTTATMLQDPSLYQTNLSLYVCKADDPIGLLDKTETIVLLEKKDIDWSLIPVIEILGERFSNVNLPCTQRSSQIVVWKKGESANDLVTTVHDVLSDNNFRSQVPERWKLEANSSLTILKIQINDESTYACHSYDSKMESFDVYHLKVIVYSSPVNPVIDGCPSDSYCVLEKNSNDTITCAVRGIRPVVDLDLQSFPPGSPDVSIINQVRTILVSNDLTDVILTAKLEFRDLSSTRHTLECIVKGDNARMFTTLSTKFEVILTDRIQPSETPWTYVIVVAVVVVCLVSIACIFSTVKRQCHRRRKEHRQQTDERYGEVNVEDTPLISVDKDIFIQQLRDTYEGLRNSLRPIPYFKNILRQVDALFLDVGIHHLVTGTQCRWSHLPSYRDVKLNFQAASKIYVLEGDPGYGKTTLTLQLAYEWCQNIPGTLLESTEILVLIRFRQLVECADIFDAIKMTLLPNESTLTKEDIKTIFATSTVAILLDGFDEYPESDRFLQSILSDMTRAQNVPRYQIILTTRSLQLPKELPPNAKRFKLCGFNSEAREEYLQKITQKNGDTAMEMRKLLKDDPIIRDICQVPLFFVLYVHLRSEGGIDNDFSSITSFFRHIVSCLHFHFKNKSDDDEDVNNFRLYEDHHEELDKITFDALMRSGGKLHIKSEHLPNQFVEHYVKVGILQKEERTVIDDTPGVLASEHIKTEHIVAFHHSIFLEWYAAHYVAAILSTRSTQDHEDGWEILDDIDGHRVPYLYRFVCGISPDAAEHIFSHLRSTEDGDELAALCLLEQQGDVGRILNRVDELCSKEIMLTPTKTRLVNRSTIQMMELASSNNVDIPSLSLNDFIVVADEETDELILGTDLRLPILQTLRSLWVDKPGYIFSHDDVTGILKYARKCQGVKEITFSNCILPFLVEDEPAASIIGEGKIQVSWYTTTCVIYYIDAESGKWKNKDGADELAEEYYKTEEEEFKEMYRDMM